MSKNLHTNRIGVVIVSYGHATEIEKLLLSLVGQTKKNDSIIVVDNHPSKDTFKLLENNQDVERCTSDNKGFANACNFGAERIKDKVDILFFINPDTSVSQNMLSVIRKYGTERFSAWMPMLLLPSGKVNSAGNAVHITGLSWTNGYLAEAVDYKAPFEISFLSGACMVIGVDAWNDVGGLTEEYFMYYEDTDFSTRLVLAGYKIGLIPDAYVTHDYDYKKGPHKWIYIERNRLLYIIRTWPTTTILILLPILIITEVLLWPVALLQGRFLTKLKGAVLFFAALPWSIKSRRRVQRQRNITSGNFLRRLSYKFDNKNLGILSNNKFINKCFELYFRFALSILLHNKE